MRPARSVAGLLALVICLASVGCAKPGTSPSSSSSAGPAGASPSPTVSFLGTHYPSQGHRHFALGESADFDYNSNPPTSGPHKEVFNSTFNSAVPLAKYLQVHLLEHGNVLLQYDCNCPEIAGALYQIAYRYDAKLFPETELQPAPVDVQRAEDAGLAVIVAPYPGMKHKIALTAWTQLATLDAVDQAKIMSFIDAYLHNTANASQ